jgi:uncharacterized protein YkwD
MSALVARRVSTGVAAVVTVLIFAGAVNAAPTATLTQAESSLLIAMNEARQVNGLQPLQADMRLERAARSHSSHMLRTGTFAHGAFNARIRGTGVHARRVGENLAWGQGSLGVARSIVAMWLASPEHRANLLHPGYRLVGVGALRGCFDGRRHTLMVTTDFAGR